MVIHRRLLFGAKRRLHTHVLAPKLVWEDTTCSTKEPSKLASTRGCAKIAVSPEVMMALLSDVALAPKRHPCEARREPSKSARSVSRQDYVTAVVGHEML